jgi:tRNA nucleotidyltransferase (CCA-adding enzyme)
MTAIIQFLKGLFPPSCHERVFLVGGSVRDRLLGREAVDIDLAAALSPEEYEALGFRLVTGKSTAPIRFRHDRRFGTIEVTPLTDKASLTDDLGRRDFTVNALAMTLDGELIDPLGGRTDLGLRRLRPCSPAAFLDDPLRILRAFRFEADGWVMTADCEAQIRGQEWSRRLTAIPVERFSREMLKALEAPQPERFFLRMLESGIGDCWLPELFRMPSVPAGPKEHHPEGDLLTHALQVMERVAERTGDPMARFCALFHDIGKLATDPALYPKHHGHDEAGFDLGRSLCDRLRLPTTYRHALAWTSRLHGTLNRWPELRGSTRIRSAEQALKAGIAGILPLVSTADKPGGLKMDEWKMAVRVAAMTTAELGIDAERIEAMPEDKRAAFIQQLRVEALRMSKPELQ